MRYGRYVKDKMMVIVFQIVGILAFSVYLRGIGVARDSVLLGDGVWIFCLWAGSLIDFKRRDRYLFEMENTAYALKQRYLLSDVIKEPQTNEDEIYQKVMRMANKSMIEEVTKIKHEQDEYREYIEQWVHEMKTPLAAMKLVCENEESGGNKKLLREMEIANHYVEQVLYYARSEYAWKDYLLKETNLETIVNQAILDTKTILREKNIRLDVHCDALVYTDAKWMTFIVEQCILNSCQYGATAITIYIEDDRRETILSVLDNGIGIPIHEISRIGEKGFTGRNGRNYKKSTGIGLYLCKKLCNQLDVGFQVKSEEHYYTAVHLTFTKAGRS